MPITTRVIPCLDVADGRVVKGIQFENLVDVGDPVDMADDYYRAGADEITFLDVNASKEKRSTVLDLVRRTAERVFIPLTVGGGIRSTLDVALLLEAGADKVSLASAAIQEPELIREISNRFGSQVLVVSLDLRRSPKSTSGFTVTSHGGSVDTGIDAGQWLIRVQELGAGELLVNSIDTDGTKGGFDIELLELVVGLSTVPVIASGGAGSTNHFVSAAATGVDAVLAASVFHRGELSVAQVKQALSTNGFLVRTAA
jgi:cyclase